MYAFHYVHDKSSVDPKVRSIVTKVSEFDYKNLKEIARGKKLSLSGLLREALWHYQKKQERIRISATRNTRVKIARLKGSHSQGSWKRLVKDFGGVCARCAHPDRPVTKDHIIPLWSGGSDDISNLQPLCMECNVKNPAGMNWRKKRGIRDENY